MTSGYTVLQQLVFYVTVDEGHKQLNLSTVKTRLGSAGCYRSISAYLQVGYLFVSREADLRISGR